MILKDEISQLEKNKLLEIITDRETQINGKRIRRGQKLIRMAVYSGIIGLSVFIVLPIIYALDALLLGLTRLFPILNVWNVALFILLIFHLIYSVFIKKLNETQPIILNIFKYRPVQPIEWNKAFYPNVNKVIVFSDVLMIHYAKERKKHNFFALKRENNSEIFEQIIEFAEQNHRLSKISDKTFKVFLKDLEES